MTLMLAGVAALTVSAQQQAKTFPSAAVKTEGPAKAPLFKPAAAPANIDDKANGTLMYATTSHRRQRRNTGCRSIPTVTTTR